MTEQVKFVDIGTDEETFVPESAVEQITSLSRFAHGVLSGYSKAFGQELSAWNNLNDKEQGHIIGRVAHFMTFPEAEASAPHDSWRMRLALSGWSMGAMFNAETKTRPDLHFFNQLPPEQQAQDYIIKSIIHEAFHKQ